MQKYVASLLNAFCWHNNRNLSRSSSPRRRCTGALHQGRCCCPRVHTELPNPGSTPSGLLRSFLASYVMLCLTLDTFLAALRRCKPTTSPAATAAQGEKNVFGTVWGRGNGRRGEEQNKARKHNGDGLWLPAFLSNPFLPEPLNATSSSYVVSVDPPRPLRLAPAGTWLPLQPPVGDDVQQLCRRCLLWMHCIVGHCYCRTRKACTVHMRNSNICLSKMLFIVGVSLRRLLVDQHQWFSNKMECQSQLI
jgi:hypothetical protein